MSQDDYERITLRLPKPLARKVKQEAKKNNKSVNSYLLAAADFATKHLVFFAAVPEAPVQQGLGVPLKSVRDAPLPKALGPVKNSKVLRGKRA
jgi:hypothetical protein